jgi:hypothetical protein
MTTPRPTGAITPALLHIRSSLDSLLQPFGWSVSTADTPFQKFAALSAPGAGGKCLVSWSGDRKLDQAGDSLVIRATIAVTLAAKKDAVNPEAGRLAGDTPRLYEIHDRVKGAMLAIRMPDETVPEPGADILVYSGSRPLQDMSGTLLDAIEQTWECELSESFAPA